MYAIERNGQITSPSRTIMQPQNKKPPNQMFMKFNIPRSGLSKATENNCAAASNDQRVNAYIKMTCTKCGPYQATIPYAGTANANKASTTMRGI